MGIVFAMLIWMALHTDRYFDKKKDRYYKITFGNGNPLNAVFFRDLLSEAGLQWRAMIGKVLTIVWILFVVVIIVESSLA